MSIMDPKNAGSLDVGDFGLKKKYSLPRAAQQIGAYNSAMAQVCSRKAFMTFPKINSDVLIS